MTSSMMDWLPMWKKYFGAGYIVQPGACQPESEIDSCCRLAKEGFTNLGEYVVMNRETRLDLLVILMVLSALGMFALAAVYVLPWPPAITGVGFLIATWGFRLLK